MREPDVTPFESRLASRLRSHAGIEVPPVNALAIARDVMAIRHRTGFAAVWSSLRVTTRIAIVAAMLSTALLTALIVGSQLVRDPLTVTVPEASPARTSDIPSAGPAPEDLRSRWLAFVDEIPGLGNGSGPVTLTIDPTGSLLSLANLTLGASFTSQTSAVGVDELRLVLLSAGSGCEAGAEGVYRLNPSPDRGRLTFVAISDACSLRSAALSRTWDRTLVGPTTVGAGVVDTFDPMFFVALPEHRYEARVLQDWIEIGDPVAGFSLMVFKNPQGFADACSPEQVRFPYTPGAVGFVEYYRQNDAFIVVEATPLRIDGHDAIHLVTKVRVEGARCPGAELYALTPRACDCHFFGGNDSLYLVDVGEDTFLFQLTGTTDVATEMEIINTIRIPYSP